MPDFHGDAMILDLCALPQCWTPTYWVYHLSQMDVQEGIGHSGTPGLLNINTGQWVIMK